MNAPDQADGAPAPAKGREHDAAKGRTDERERPASVSREGESWLNVQQCEDDYFKKSEVLER